MAASGLNRSVGESALTEAQALAAVKLLFELGADARGATTNGENALFGAAYRGWNTLLALLIEKGADVNAVSKAGVTPWLAASGYGDRLGGVLYNTEGANLLLEARRRPEARQAVPGADQVPVTHAEDRADAAASALRRVRWRRSVWLAAPSRPPARRREPARRQRRLPAAPATPTPAREPGRHLLRHLPQRARQGGGFSLDSRRRDAGRQLRRDLGKGRRASCAAARCRRPACAGPTTPPTTPWPRGWSRSWTAPPPRVRIPGRPADLHRLNRTEYANAVRDLLGVEIDPRRCCRPTRRPTASTPTPTRCRWSRRCSIAI